MLVGSVVLLRHGSWLRNICICSLETGTDPGGSGGAAASESESRKNTLQSEAETSTIEKISYEGELL